MKKIKKYAWIMCLLGISVGIIVLVVVIGLNKSLDSGTISNYVQMITNISTIGGVILALITLVDAKNTSMESKNITKGQFVFELHKEFSNEAYGNLIFEECWTEYVDGEESEEQRIQNERFWESQSENLVKYLTFFETLFVMYKSSILTIDDLNDLFGRRFFVVINNKHVQKDLLNNWKYYKNVYRLYAVWKKERNGELFAKTESAEFLYTFEKIWAEDKSEDEKECIQKFIEEIC